MDDRPMSTCPTCSAQDQTVRISGLVDSDHSRTQGTSKGTTVGYIDGPAIAHTTAHIDMNTRTVLADRFRPPGLPDRPLRAAAYVGLVVTVIIAVVWGAIGGSDNALTAGGLVGLAAGWLVRSQLDDDLFAARLTTWTRCKEALRAGYYCRRDDIAFEPGSSLAFTPEHYVERCYAPLQAQIQDDDAGDVSHLLPWLKSKLRKS